MYESDRQTDVAAGAEKSSGGLSVARGMFHGEGVRRIGRLTAIKQRKRYDYGFQYWDDTPTFKEAIVYVAVLVVVFGTIFLVAVVMGA